MFDYIRWGPKIGWSLKSIFETDDKVSDRNNSDDLPTIRHSKMPNPFACHNIIGFSGGFIDINRDNWATHDGVDTGCIRIQPLSIFAQGPIRSRYRFFPLPSRPTDSRSVYLASIERSPEGWPRERCLLFRGALRAPRA